MLTFSFLIIFTLDWFGPLPASPAEMYITNEQDLPGWDASFDGKSNDTI